MMNLTERVEMESGKSPAEFLEEIKSKGRLNRNDLLTYSDAIFRIAFEKLYGRSTSAPDRLSWARVISSTISAVSSTIKDNELDDLKKDVEAIKKRLESSTFSKG